MIFTFIFQLYVFSENAKKFLTLMMGNKYKYYYYVLCFVQINKLKIELLYY